MLPTEPKINYKKFILDNFKILDRELQTPIPFQFNPVQEKYYDLLIEQYGEKLLGVREVVLKARQEGMCLDRSTKILTSDLRWIPISEVKVGQALVAVEEFPRPGRGSSRRLKKTIVEGIRTVFKPAFKLIMSDGRELIATAEHRFLSHKRGGTDTIWRTVADTNVGDEIRYITKPWDGVTLEDAWFSGVIDGEGTLRRKERAGCELTVSQVPGFVWERLVDYAERSNFNYRIDWDRRDPGISSQLGKKPVGRLVFGRMNELFELIGKTRPTRMITREWWVDKELPGKNSGQAWEKVVAIEPLGEREMFDLQTSEKTFIAEGFVSHNSSFILALFTVDFLLRPDSVSICISHTKQATDLLFRKVKFYLRCYFNKLSEKTGEPVEEIEKRFLKSNSKSEIANNENNAVFYILTAGAKVGGRGGSARNILFSEAAFYADTEQITAEEMITGTAQQVPLGRGMIFIESTANGEGNYYHTEWERANLPANRKGERQSIYTPRFFGWDQFYTEAWVNEKKKEFSSEKKWKQEYPRTPDEAFITSGTPFFQMDILQAMLDVKKEPIQYGKIAPDGQIDPLGVKESPIRVYRDLEYGEQTVIFGDPAESNDFCAAVVCSKKHYDFPIVFNEVMESSQFGYELNSLAKYVFHKTGMWPKMAIERNTGQATIYVLKTLNYPDLFRMVDFSAQAGDYEKGQIGWVTTGFTQGGELQGTRRKMLDDFSLALRQGQVQMYDEIQIKQFKTFAIIKGKAQAKRSKKDDLVIATCGAWQIHQITPSYNLDDFDVEEFRRGQQKWRFK